MTYKELLSGTAITLTLLAYYPYIREIVRGNTRPHVFSWVIWGAVTFAVFLAQLEGKGGVGAWPIGVSGSITLVTAYLAYVKRADITITITDWIFLVSALSALPVWYLTADPVWAVIILTAVDILGFGPTVRKAYHAPQSESLLFYALIGTRNVLVVVALEYYSLTTLLFPIAAAVACFSFITMVSFRRRLLAP